MEPSSWGVCPTTVQIRQGSPETFWMVSTPETPGNHILVETESEARKISATLELLTVAEKLVRWFNTETPAECDELSLLEDIMLPATEAVNKALNIKGVV
jgi:hypothetical protein